MASILVIGSTGMLGSTVTKFLASTNHEVIESNTSGNPLISSNVCVKFDILTNSAEELLKQVSVPIDYIINCSGVIKHKIDDNDLKSVKDAERVNSDFPSELAIAGNAKSLRIIQIATDCVFSGKVGLYDEDSKHDATDIYGVTKSKGETKFDNLMILRCSVIGREINSHVEFIDWILGQTKDAKLNGFSNHMWNGITTLHFAKIVLGIVSANTFKSGKHHVVPRNSASKFEMINMICKSFAREDIQIEKVLAETAIDRRLDTKFPVMNRDLWLNAGYDKPLSIQEMITEYANWVETKKNV
jgi:dTDP-4-dehydrorhamnose reductase